VCWPTVEHYFQAQKFLDPEMADYRERIRNAASLKDARVLGPTEKLPLRPDWEQVKEDVMRHALRRKFENLELGALLLSTGTRLLMEDSPYDTYWGSGKNGKDRNRLGVLLMELREELRK
jgi:hypothetical protein